MISSVILTISYLKGDLIGIQFKTLPEGHVLQEYLKHLSPPSQFATCSDMIQILHGQARKTYINREVILQEYKASTYICIFRHRLIKMTLLHAIFLTEGM